MELTEEFLQDFRNQKPKFGFNGLGEFVFERTYARKKEDGTRETWVDTLSRVVNETIRLISVRGHVRNYILKESKKRDQKSLTPEECLRILGQEMFKRMFDFKFLPAGRGIWAMGSPMTKEKGVFDCLCNCAFVSTARTSIMHDQLSRPFVFTMEMLMLGVGVGWDTRMVEKFENLPPISLHRPSWNNGYQKYVIEDSREGWVESLKITLDQYLVPGKPFVELEYSKIRDKGKPLVSFGGTASGHEPLKKLLDGINNLCLNYLALHGGLIDERWVADVMNMIGVCVVCGGIRRTAMIGLGTPHHSFVDLKNYEINPERKEFGWSSNNSVVVTRQDFDYTQIAENILKNGEPGVFWLKNAQRYGRLADVPTNRDHRATGTNPCGEQTLESFELCNLVEVFISKHDNGDDFRETLFYAQLYAKLVSNLPMLYPESNIVVSRNRRIGISLTGIADFLENHTLHELRGWMDYGYRRILEDEETIKEYFGFPISIKLTTVKPSGTLSLLGGVCAGIHWPEGAFMLRRVVLPENDIDLIKKLKDHGIFVYQDKNPPNFIFAVFPIKYPPKIAAQRNRTIWEQLSLIELVQTYWSDNQVSCTVKFDPKSIDAPEISRFLQSCSLHLKSIAMIAHNPTEAYANLPFEEITREKYERMLEEQTPEIDSDYLVLNTEKAEDPFSERDFCDSESGCGKNPKKE